MNERVHIAAMVKLFIANDPCWPVHVQYLRLNRYLIRRPEDEAVEGEVEAEGGVMSQGDVGHEG